MCKPIQTRPKAGRALSLENIIRCCRHHQIGYSSSLMGASNSQVDAPDAIYFI